MSILTRSVAPAKASKRHQMPCIRVIESCELPFGCWESNLDPLEEQPVLLTTDIFLQPNYF